MPERTIHVEAELALDYAGVVIYHAYRDNDFDQGTREYWFVTTPHESEDDAFDARDLVPHVPSGELFKADKCDILTIMREGIDAGFLTQDGIELPEAEGINDADLSPEQLDDKYNPDGDGEYPNLTREEWRMAVIRKDTISGYWVWVHHMLTVNQS